MPHAFSTRLFRVPAACAALLLCPALASLAADPAAEAYRQARACLVSNRFDEAAARFEAAAATTNPAAAAAAWLGRGEALFGAQRWAESAAAYDRLLTACPASALAPNALCGRGFAEARAGSLSQALATFQSFAARFPGHALAATAAASAGSIARTLEDGEKRRAAEALARDTEALNGCVREGRYPEAADAAERFLQANPGAANLAEVRLLAAECAFRAQDYPRAQNAYRRFLGLHAGHPQAPRAWLELGKTLQALSRFAEAAEAFERAGREGQAEALRADSLCRAGRHAEALPLYETLSRGSTNKLEQARLTLALGDCHAALRKWEEAERLYLSVETLHASDALRPVALGRLAELYERAGQTNQAARAREELRRRYPPRP